MAKVLEECLLNLGNQKSLCSIHVLDLPASVLGVHYTLGLVKTPKVIVISCT